MAENLDQIGLHDDAAEWIFTDEAHEWMDYGGNFAKPHWTASAELGGYSPNSQGITWLYHGLFNFKDLEDVGPAMVIESRQEIFI